MQVNIGTLNKRIEIVEKDKTEKDKDGFSIITNKIVRSCWASYNKVSGTEMIKSNADFTSEKCRFLIRYSKTLLSRKMLVKYNDKKYEIDYINDYNDAHEFVELICTRMSIGD